MSSTIAVLFNPDAGPLKALEEAELKNILSPPINIGSAGQMLAVSSQRDQIQIQFLANKIDVQDNSGKVNHARDKIPDVLQGIVTLAGDPALMSYGFNFVISVPITHPEEWIGRHLLASTSLEANPKSPTVALRLERAPKEWLIRFDATTLPESIIVNFNSSESLDTLPSLEELSSGIQTQYDSLMDYLRKLELVE